MSWNETIQNLFKSHHNPASAQVKPVEPITDRLQAIEVFDEVLKKVHPDILKETLNAALEPFKWHAHENPTKKKAGA